MLDRRRIAAESLLKFGWSLVSYARAILRECDGKETKSAILHVQAHERLEDFLTYRDWYRCESWLDCAKPGEPVLSSAPQGLKTATQHIGDKHENELG